MFIFAGAKNKLLHILLNIASMYYKIALLMRMYVQYGVLIVEIEFSNPHIRR
jgi:hypothetical protein